MEIIYIKLQNEEVDVWRPVHAIFNSEDITYYIIPPPKNIVPKDEVWEFSPGMNIKVKNTELEGKLVKVATSI